MVPSGNTSAPTGRGDRRTPPTVPPVTRPA